MTYSRAPGRVADLFESCSNGGRWGREDERGTLNLITSDVVLRALQTCREGAVVALGRPLVPARGAIGTDCPPEGLQLRVYQGPSGCDALDTQVVSPHGFDVTHLDAVGHSFYNGIAYNGRRMADMVRPGGLVNCGVEAMAGGVVTRAVLLDVLRCREGASLWLHGAVSAADLDVAEQGSGAEVLAGDAVLVRTGVSGGPDSEGRRTGLLADAVSWLHERHVSVYGGDCIEQLPAEDEAVPMVLHQVGHVAMGLAILDNPEMEVLRRACDRYGRQVFLLALAPLPMVGATGCPVNPLAVF